MICVRGVAPGPLRASGGRQGGIDTTEGRQFSTLGQPRLAQPVKTMIEVLGVLVDGKGHKSFDRETGVDSQHLYGLLPGLLNVSRLRIADARKK